MESVLILDYSAPGSMIHYRVGAGKNESKEIASSNSFTAFRTNLAMTMARKQWVTDVLDKQTRLT